MARTPRRRRLIAPWTLFLLRPIFRYSLSRDAYILRIAGGVTGPVLRNKREWK